jgi:hypothetical protein
MQSLIHKSIQTSLAAFVVEQTVPAWVQLGADEFPG